MKKGHKPIPAFMSVVLLFCFFIAGCSKKSTKQDEQVPVSYQTIRDYDYLERTFYYLGQDALMNYGGHSHSIPYQNEFFWGDSVTEMRLFKSNVYINANPDSNPYPFGITYVDPHNEDTLVPYGEEPLFRRFEETDPDSYYVNGLQYWIRLYKSLQENDILAAYYVIVRSDGKVDTVGYMKDFCTGAENDTCMKPKLIKPEVPRPGDFTWEYEWKNVYSLRARNINEKGLRLDIYKGPLNAEDPRTDNNLQDGTSYLRIFGLDQFDRNGDPQPDGLADHGWIDFVSGYLFFPQRYPFSPPSGVSYTGDPADTLKERVGAIYNSASKVDRREDSKYYIYVEMIGE
jgi:hypothetical protein